MLFRSNELSSYGASFVLVAVVFDIHRSSASSSPFPSSGKIDRVGHGLLRPSIGRPISTTTTPRRKRRKWTCLLDDKIQVELNFHLKIEFFFFLKYLGLPYNRLGGCWLQPFIEYVALDCGVIPWLCSAVAG